MITNDNLSPNGKYRISATNELTVEELEENPQIKEIQVLDDRDDTGELVDAESYTTYTREEYTKIKKQISRIKDVIYKVVGDNPDVSEENKERNFFIAAYLILGMIKYDHQTVQLENEEEREQDNTSKVRNMFGGLIENSSVCLGYAQILKNVLSEFGIDSKVVIGIPQKLDFDLNSRNVEDEDFHAWNIVKLDGMEYQCDLTMDAEEISYSYGRPNLPELKYCLTKGYEFRTKHLNYDIKVLEDGMSFVEQRKLMQYYFDVFRIIHNPAIEEELEEGMDDHPVVDELMDESTNPVYIYNSDNIDDENNIDEEELKDAYKQVMGLFDKFKSKPVIFGEQDIGKATIDVPTTKKSEAQRQVTRNEQELEQGITKEN